MEYSHEEIEALTGIQVSSNYKYYLEKIHVKDLDLSGYTQEVIKIMKRITKTKEMVNRLKLGGGLPAITVYKDINNKNGLTILDGQHRVAAYLIADVKTFWCIQKFKI